MARYTPRSIEQIAAACDTAADEAAALEAMLVAMCQEFSWSAAAWWDTDEDGVCHLRATTGMLITATPDTLRAEAPAPDTITVIDDHDELPEHLTQAMTAAIIANSGIVVELASDGHPHIGSASRQVLEAAVAGASRARKAAFSRAPAPAPQAAPAADTPTAPATADALLARLNTALPEARDVTEVLTVALSVLSEERGWTWGCAWKWQSPDEHLHAAQFHGDQGEIDAATLPLKAVFEEGLVGNAYVEATPEWAPLSDDPRSDVASGAGFTTAVALPVVLNGAVISVLECWAPDAPGESERDTLRLAQRLISARVQQIRDDQRITDLAMLPTMTGLIAEALRGCAPQKKWAVAAEALVDLMWSDVVAFVHDGTVDMPEDHFDEITVESFQTGISDSIPTRCIEEGVVLDHTDLQADELWATQLSDEGFAAVLCVPLPEQSASMVLLWRDARVRDAHLNRVLGDAGKAISSLLSVDAPAPAAPAPAEPAPAPAATVDRLLTSLNTALPEARDVTEVLTVALSVLSEERGWTWGCAWKWQSPDEHLHAAQFHGDQSEIDAATLPLKAVFEEGLVGNAYVEATPEWAPLSDDPRSDVASGAGFTTAVALPVVLNGAVISVLECWAPDAPGESERDTLRLAQRLISARVQQIRDDQRITDLAMLPTMTGLIAEALRGCTPQKKWAVAAEALVDLMWSDVVAFVHDGNVDMPEDHFDEITVESFQTGISDSIPTRCIEEGVVLDHTDLQGEDPWAAQISGEGFSSMLCVPLPGQDASMVLLWRDARVRDAHLNRVLGDAGKAIAEALAKVAPEPAAGVAPEALEAIRAELEAAQGDHASTSQALDAARAELEAAQGAQADAAQALEAVRAELAQTAQALEEAQAAQVEVPAPQEPDHAELDRLVAVAGQALAAWQAGDFSARVEATDLPGALGELAAQMNATADAVAGPILASAETLAALAGGRDAAMVEQPTSGTLAELAAGVNAVIQANAQVVEVVEALVAGRLDVDVQPRCEGDRVFGGIAEAVATLGRTLSKIERHASAIHGGSQEIESGSQTLSTNAARAAESAAQIKDAAEKMRAQTAENAERATQARDGTVSVTRASEAGSAQMLTLLAAMRQIEEESSRIGNIVRVIDEIAFQTNLLALNAAVEAARAGVHGKGFAVVAEEVRNLAARSAVAAKEIDEVISMSMERNARSVKAAEASAGSLNEILDATRTVSALVTDIASASEAQRAEIGTMSADLAQLDQSIRSSAAQAEQVTATAADMTGQADAVKQKLSGFTFHAPEQELPSALSALPPELLQKILSAVQGSKVRI